MLPLFATDPDNWRHTGLLPVIKTSDGSEIDPDNFVEEICKVILEDVNKLNNSVKKDMVGLRTIATYIIAESFAQMGNKIRAAFTLEDAKTLVYISEIAAIAFLAGQQAGTEIQIETRKTSDSELRDPTITETSENISTQYS